MDIRWRLSRSGARLDDTSPSIMSVIFPVLVLVVVTRGRIPASPSTKGAKPQDEKERASYSQESVKPYFSSIVPFLKHRKCSYDQSMAASDAEGWRTVCAVPPSWASLSHRPYLLLSLVHGLTSVYQRITTIIHDSLKTLFFCHYGSPIVEDIGHSSNSL